jgi:hypothetical protein
VSTRAGRAPTPLTDGAKSVAELLQPGGGAAPFSADREQVVEQVVGGQLLRALGEGGGGVEAAPVCGGGHRERVVPGGFGEGPRGGGPEESVGQLGAVVPGGLPGVGEGSGEGRGIVRTADTHLVDEQREQVCVDWS